MRVARSKERRSVTGGQHNSACWQSKVAVNISQPFADTPSDGNRPCTGRAYRYRSPPGQCFSYSNGIACISSGKSGETIVHSVRDPVYGLIPVNKRKAGQADKAEKTLLDQGVSDKRLLIVEEEFARLLTKSALPGNTLSSMLRKAWDAKNWLYVEGKIAPEKATGAHISMIGHITVTELLNFITKVENENGFLIVFSG